MIYTELTKRAINLMFDQHRDQRDKSGLPYVFHPWHVAESMPDEITTVVALLHDVVEDTQLTIEDLRQMGYPKEVTEALALMTHEKGTDYFEYVKRLAVNPIARMVKLSDLKHNSDLTRMDEITDKVLRRREKYM
jgi:(p)ppGpp synthase/HD superfamily hydrolase